jgi:peptidyl-tRNA hydrolase, PTH1 family
MALFAFFKNLFRTPTILPDEADVLFFGLGNVTDEYVGTRHNAGFMVADALSENLTNRSNGSFGNADFAAGSFPDAKKALVIKPGTFMNRSGEAVKTYIDRFKTTADRVLVIVDDYNLPLGKLRARRGGSDGGHNGLKSIIGKIGEDFPRLRIGIGPLPPGVATVDFVLGRFTESEVQQLATVVSRAVEACTLFTHEGIEAVMNKYNR